MSEEIKKTIEKIKELEQQRINILIELKQEKTYLRELIKDNLKELKGGLS